ncbi:DUF4651 domain-containing protein [Streptococcus hongkongensis]|nr:hypothetical protein NC01_05965 [Streptococcus uberis]
MINRKPKGIIGLVGLSAVAVTALVLKEKYQENRRQKITNEIRQYFSDLGEIDALYINDYSSSFGAINGGLVMSDGRAYQFTYSRGGIVFQEEEK